MPCRSSVCSSRRDCLPVVDDGSRARVAKMAVTVALVYSIFIQAVGAFCWPESWTTDKSRPYRYRLWDWRESQIESCLKDGPANRSRREASDREVRSAVQTHQPDRVRAGLNHRTSSFFPGMLVRPITSISFGPITCITRRPTTTTTTPTIVSTAASITDVVHT